jgi:hypothetical protein
MFPEKGKFLVNFISRNIGLSDSGKNARQRTQTSCLEVSKTNTNSGADSRSRGNPTNKKTAPQ